MDIMIYNIEKLLGRQFFFICNVKSRRIIESAKGLIGFVF